MAAAMKTKIQSTRNYRLFKRSNENRVLDLSKHKKLEQSMKKYGFLPCFPIICHRNGDKHLNVKDGQHRLAFAESLGLPVHWVEDDSAFDIATINSTARVWQVKDYAMKHAANGVESYIEAIAFSDQHSLPIGIAVCLLSGNTTFGNVQYAFREGTFKVKDREWANAVASIYIPMSTLAGCLKNVSFLKACMSVCRVEEFEAKRLLQNASRCREKLVSYSTRDAYLNMLEEIYNFGRAKLFGLKAASMMAMRDRNVCLTKSK